MSTRSRAIAAHKAIQAAEAADLGLRAEYLDEYKESAERWLEHVQWGLTPPPYKVGKKEMAAMREHARFHVGLLESMAAEFAQRRKCRVNECEC